MDLIFFPALLCGFVIGCDLMFNNWNGWFNFSDCVLFTGVL